MNEEATGPAEQIVSALTTFISHIYHNRPGIVTKHAGSAIGLRWEPVIWKEEKGEKVVYRTVATGKRKRHVRVGVMNGTNEVREGGQVVGEYRKPGVFTEAAVYFYRQIAEVWKLDNEFSARWASWAFPREHRDLKVVLCAFMLVQNRRGDPVKSDGEILFFDEDYRDVGEAMALIRSKSKDKNADLHPKLLLRVGDILNLPEIAEINRELGFGKSARNPARGRYYKAVEKWLRHREENIPMLEGLVKAGFRTTVQKLARRVGYKPISPKFFELLRWKQAQAKDGRRDMAIGKAVKAADTWQNLTENEICERITKEKLNWKRIIGMPSDVGITRAIVAAAIEAGCMSDQDLIILTPTLEEFGLLKDKDVEKRWKAAIDKAENQRAANIAKNVKSKATKEVLQEAVDKATEKAFEEVTKDLRVYCIVDKSGSMEGALEKAQEYLTKFLGGFPLDRLHVSVFNSEAKEIKIKSPKAEGVAQAFRGENAGGGTSYAQGVQVLAKYQPEEGEDALMIFVGDEEDYRQPQFASAVRNSGINPVAFGLMRIVGGRYCRGDGTAVRDTATELGIPCFSIDTNMFESDDPYAITRLLQNLIAATPVGERTEKAFASKRKSLVQEILGTNILTKPVWA